MITDEHIIEVKGGVGQHVTDLRDEITRLRAENQRLREALTEIATGRWGDVRTAFVIVRDIARAALKENSDE